MRLFKTNEESRLIEQIRPIVVGVAVEIVGRRYRDGVDDVCQNTYSKVIAMHRTGNLKDPEAFARRSAEWCSYDFLRKQDYHRNHSTNDDALESASDEATVCSTVLEEREWALKRSTEVLSETELFVFRRTLEGVKPKAIAAQLGKNAGHIRRVLAIVTKRLRSKAKQEFQSRDR